MGKKFKYHIAADHIIDMIRCGDAIDKLPGERILAAETGYSYMTIRKALEFLDEKGIIRKSPKRGTYAVTSAKAISSRKKIALIDADNSGLKINNVLIHEIHKFSERFDFDLYDTEASDCTGFFDGAIIIQPNSGIFDDIPALKLIPSVAVESWIDNQKCGIVCSDYYSSVYQALEKTASEMPVNDICFYSGGGKTRPDEMIRKALYAFSKKYTIDVKEYPLNTISVRKEKCSLKIIFPASVSNDESVSILIASGDGLYAVKLVPGYEQIAFDTNRILREIIDGGRVLRSIVKMEMISGSSLL